MKALGAFLFASIILAAPPCLPPLVAQTDKVDSALHEMEGSGVHGTIMLVDLPAGGTLAVVNLEGLTPDARYLVVRTAGGSCDIESYDEDDAIADLAGNATGRATSTLELDQEIGELATISVWTPEDALVACAAIR
jgi:hypothetical protein